MGAQAKIRAERSRERRDAERWKPVTNQDVIKAADPSCKACTGDGMAFAEDHRPVVCPCAPPRFAAKYAGRLRPAASGGAEFREASAPEPSRIVIPDLCDRLGRALKLSRRGA